MVDFFVSKKIIRKRKDGVKMQIIKEFEFEKSLKQRLDFIVFLPIAKYGNRLYNKNILTLIGRSENYEESRI